MGKAVLWQSRGCLSFGLVQSHLSISVREGWMVGKTALRLFPSLVTPCWFGARGSPLSLLGRPCAATALPAGPCDDFGYYFRAYLCRVLCKPGDRVVMKTPLCSLFSHPRRSVMLPTCLTPGLGILARSYTGDLQMACVWPH